MEFVVLIVVVGKRTTTFVFIFHRTRLHTIAACPLHSTETNLCVYFWQYMQVTQRQNFALISIDKYLVLGIFCDTNGYIINLSYVILCFALL